MNLVAVLNEVSGWPVEQQLELVETVWGRLVDSGWQPELSDEQRAELTRRLDDLKANPEKVLSHEEVLKHLRRKR